MLQILCELFFFLKIMTDPDAPSPSDPYLREHLHWFVSSSTSFFFLFVHTAFKTFRRIFDFKYIFDQDGHRYSWYN